MTKLKHKSFKIRLKIRRNSGHIKTYHTTKTKRFYAILKAENFQKAYLKVSYGKQKTNFGKIEDFYNDGDYETKTELLQAFRAFTEPNTSSTVSVPVRNH